jgi:hypothetical protein
LDNKLQILWFAFRLWLRRKVYNLTARTKLRLEQVAVFFLHPNSIYFCLPRLLKVTLITPQYGSQVFAVEMALLLLIVGLIVLKGLPLAVDALRLLVHD